MSFLDVAGSLASAFISKGIADDNRESQERMNEQNRQMQLEFAKNGVSWKVADARNAGINPLAALGASTQSYSNLVAAQTDSSYGQDIGRAIRAAGTADDREYTKAKQALDLQHGELENQLLSSQIAKTRGEGPAMPAVAQKYLIDGQGPTVLGGSSATVKVKPDEVTAKSPSDPSVGAGSHTDMSFSNIGDGYYIPIPSGDLAATYSSGGTGAKMWDLRNLYLPAIGVNQHVPYPPPSGKEWGYNPFMGYSLRDRRPGYVDRFVKWGTKAWDEFYATHGGTGY